MRENKKHTENIDQQIRQLLDNNYEPSANFVDKVMEQIDNLETTKPAAKYLKISFQAVAACAIVIFFTNALILLSSSASVQNENDWATVYEQTSTSNWYEYYYDETLTADNQIKE